MIHPVKRINLLIFVMENEHFSVSYGPNFKCDYNEKALSIEGMALLFTRLQEQ